MEDRGYTWFGEVLYRILKERGSSQSALAREARERGLDYRQNSVSIGCEATRRAAGAAYSGGGSLRPEHPGVDRPGLAFAYGQRVKREGSSGPPRFQNAIQRFFIEETGWSSRRRQSRIDLGGGTLDSSELRHLWNKTRVSVAQDSPEGPEETLTLEVRPEEVKVLYARVLALQSLVDRWLDPREIEYLYVFMSRVSMSSDSREEVRQTLATREASPEDVVRLVEEVISAVPDNQEEIAVSIIKDMVHVSRADNVVLPRKRPP